MFLTVAIALAVFAFLAWHIVLLDRVNVPSERNDRLANVTEYVGPRYNAHGRIIG